MDTIVEAIVDSLIVNGKHNRSYPMVLWEAKDQL